MINPHLRVERWMMRLCLYQFEVKYKPGKENILADILSRPNEHQILPSHEDFLDLLVASVFEEKNEYVMQINEDKGQRGATTCDGANANVIAIEPSSETPDEYVSYIEEQRKDPDIQWIKELIPKNGENRPEVKTFANTTQRIF
jgi:hypothetical protein